MPEYQDRNALECDVRADVPQSFWTGETDMACVRNVMQQLRSHAYAHHIQRLMVMGLFAQLLGVHPYRFHQWHLAMYADAVDWVSLPNALGMSQFGDGGVVGTKPYCATGQYINRMSNYCRNCRYLPAATLGDDACPFTVLYWDFLARHRDRFSDNNRLQLQMKNLDKKRKEIRGIRREAERLVDRLRTW
jgi:deoxyribodipyrimidine photolyase-related protein